MSSEDWRIEFEKLNDIPVLEGELEWVMSVIDKEQSKNRSDATEESDGSNSTS